MMISPNRLQEIIQGGESLTVEFKGEERGPLPDGELIEAVVCLANGQGGTLLIGDDLDPMERALEVEELLALWRAWWEGTVTAQALAPSLQRSAAHAADVLAGLAQAGLLQAAEGLYRLAPALLREAGLEHALVPPRRPSWPTCGRMAASPGAR